MTEVDELFELRNSFYLGNFTAAVNEANKLKLGMLKYMNGFEIRSATLNSFKKLFLDI